MEAAVKANQTQAELAILQEALKINNKCNRIVVLQLT
jgi:hypothetical protein